MILIEKRWEDHTNLEGLEHDVVRMTWEERRKSRQRVTSQAGVELAIGLPTGSVLEDGEILYLDRERYITVEAAKEDVLCIHPQSPSELALAAYEIGNRHLPIAIADGRLTTLFDPLFEAHMKRLGMTCERSHIPFGPMRKGHSHG